MENSAMAEEMEHINLNSYVSFHILDFEWSHENYAGFTVLPWKSNWYCFQVTQVCRLVIARTTVSPHVFKDYCIL
jgi:hypothetical protein